ncbi:tetratricopeptide repeat protein [Bifidobacterium crudilactis]|jgi:tetratricopeptide (TPR) repeat protein|uniref:Tetratricopeptide repeat protein n=1 Tax=Bifidobacterium crudilactis TaxID=327277 RepID=A0A971CYG5_9BIFI|nr:tetratricopeptide repeat protein [Bifidobacterium crudilactis]MCI1664617.1 tetratricopeptide repeat protein [Bifidobacterium crudilactis]MDN5972488.1 tetratricopeptide repeat protein [Bifidobacterium crudilactis]MDN6000933.1 tetratricopeptide repeat protein [Bifidobacterium crudilactis]MDN6209913.1 tetratricopeptide repeat protein [Bifidobacterium crudilactis]MDN6234620.1 tetratricopeptide repeat protein [Bifidobacterium crudilactis]
MTDSWDDKIADFWAAADGMERESAIIAMRNLVGELPKHDPRGAFEWASVHDFLGLEEQAIPLYRAALEQGLSGARRSQAVIQLASSLRNIGDAESAIAILSQEPGSEETGDAAQAFLALALRDAGRCDEALRIALTALARSLPMYAHAVERYAAQQ